MPWRIATGKWCLSIICRSSVTSFIGLSTRTLAGTGGCYWTWFITGKERWPLKHWGVCSQLVCIDLSRFFFFFQLLWLYGITKLSYDSFCKKHEKEKLLHPRGSSMVVTSSPKSSGSKRLQCWHLLSSDVCLVAGSRQHSCLCFYSTAVHVWKSQ